MTHVFNVNCHQILLNAPPPIAKTAKFCFSISRIENTRLRQHLIPIIFRAFRFVCHGCGCCSCCFSSLHHTKCNLSTIHLSLTTSRATTSTFHDESLNLALPPAPYMVNQRLRACARISSSPTTRIPHPHRYQRVWIPFALQGTGSRRNMPTKGAEAKLFWLTQTATHFALKGTWDRINARHESRSKPSSESGTCLGVGKVPTLCNQAILFRLTQKP